MNIGVALGGKKMEEEMVQEEQQETDVIRRGLKKFGIDPDQSYEL